MPDKAEVRSALRESIARALAQMAHAAQQTREGATHEENRAEGDKDTRATEQSYIARGQAMRVEELAEQLARVEAMPVRAWGDDEPIAAGALVRVRIDGEEQRTFFVTPWGGGTELSVAGITVTCVAPATPVGRALCGRREGDELELAVRGAAREWEIERVT